MDEQLPTGVRAPRQQRSRDTMDRILGATTELLADQTFDDLNVADIAAAADVSIGSFYARFADKTAVLRELERYLNARSVRVASRMLTRDRWADVALAPFISEFFELILERHPGDEGLLRALVLHANVDPEHGHEFLAGRAKVLAAMRTSFVDRVLERAAEVGHPAPAVAAGTAFDLVVALSEQRLFLPTTAVDQAEITRMVLAYLHSPVVR